jgi:ADP-ribosylation factor GTPase-activating protein 2/3
MKVGGNESATKFFQSNGGTAALNSKDPKTKYQSAAATKYKEELKRRAAKDEAEYPGEVVITDGPAFDGAATPAGEPEDDFFSSWDKPAIKRPTPPISRTATPPVMGRTPSPFLNAGSNGNGIARAPSPLASEGEAAKPVVSRAVHSSALRKSSATGAPVRKTNVLGAKKTKLGAKKLTGEVIDFDAAERKAKEEAERIAKLGYDPEEEEATAAAAARKNKLVEKAAERAPASESRTSYGSGAAEKSGADVERLGMGVARLGFGQIGGAKKPAEQKKMGGFGSVGPIKAREEGMLFMSNRFTRGFTNTNTDDSEKYARQKFGTQKAISSDEFFGKGVFDPSAQSEAKSRLQGFEGATAISSNAYFGHPEDDEAAGGIDDYGDLESVAKDFIRKFGNTAGDDLDNLTALAGDAAGRLQGAIARYLNS